MAYYVYAIRLDRDTMGPRPPRKFRDANDHMDWDYPLHRGCEFFYVGQSAHTPECRFEQHKHCHADAATQSARMTMLRDPSATRVKLDFTCICKRRAKITGSRSNSYVRRYGLELAPEHYAHLNLIKGRKAALQAEKALASALREQGHCVWWG